MKEQMEKRLEELRAELAAGEKLLAELQAKQASVQQTMLRIAGAIQVLQELLGQEVGPAQEASPDDGEEPPLT
ncbi:MAG: hypothetical protein ACJ8AT_06585 [Hyalangium sp.]|uniref:hypothetical protein n=1 Tax=Hyalangium sp. TaxID=2028555 RepID=UPI00389AD0FE